MNILFIACDTTRVDHLSCHGYFRETTPNIDSIARGGVIFEDFYNAGAPTGPCFTCIYTGLHAIHHKYYAFTLPNVRQVDDLTFTMPEILKAWGYTTVAVDNLVSFAPHSKHWVRGYDYYINPKTVAIPVLPGSRVCDLTADYVNKRLIPWIKNRPDEEFFLFIHYWDPHTVYNQPQEYRKVFHHEKGTLSDLEVVEAPAGYQYVPGWGKVGELCEDEVTVDGGKVSIDLYDGEIRYMDNRIGEVIATLKDEGIFEDTLIVITSDHGEDLYQHVVGGRKQWGHSTLHDTVTHVPLVMRYPKRLPRGVRVKGFGQHIDLLPTILDIIGTPMDSIDMDGKSLLPLIGGKTVKSTIFMETAGRTRGLRTERWKLIKDTVRQRLELYDVENDPLENTNLIEAGKQEAEELKEKLDEWVRENLAEGQKDPMIYPDMGELSTSRLEFKAKWLQLLRSFEKAKK